MSNPCLSDNENVSKIILDKTNSVVSSVQIMQYKNSKAAIKWFKNI